MAIGVIGAFQNQFDTNRAGLSSAVNGQFYFGELPAQAVIPFLVLNHTGETPEWTFEGSYKETTNLTITAFVPKNMENLETMVQRIKDCFDWQESSDGMQIDKAKVIKVERTNYVASVDELREPGGELVYKGEVSFEVLIRRTLPTS